MKQKCDWCTNSAAYEVEGKRLCKPHWYAIRQLVSGNNESKGE